MNELYTASILEYILNNNIKQALLINGEWGCGKTYYLQNTLKQKTEKIDCNQNTIKIKYIYVSLFGLESIKQLSTQLAAERIISLASKKGEPSSRIRGYLPYLYREIPKIIGSILPKVYIPDDILSIILDVKNTHIEENERIVIILDDLERMSIEIDDLFGLINQFVEHSGLRVILVANTAEIKDKRLTSFNQKKEKVIGQTLDFNPPHNDIINGIIHELKGIATEYSAYLKSETDNIVQICKAANIFNARSIQRAIAVYSRFFSEYCQYGVADNAIREVFHALVFLALLTDNGMIMKEEAVVFTTSPWEATTSLLPYSLYVKQHKMQNDASIEYTPDEDRLIKTHNMLMNYPFNSSYPIPMSVINYMQCCEWDNEKVRSDCQELKELQSILDDAVSRLISHRFYLYNNSSELKKDVEKKINSIRENEYGTGLIFQLGNSFASIEELQLFPALHEKFEEAVQYLDTHYSTEELSQRTPNIQTLSEHEHFQKSSDPQYTVAFNLLEKIHDNIYHSQNKKKYVDESTDISSLFCANGGANLFADDDFIQVICEKMESQSLSLVNIYALLKETNPTFKRILAIYGADSTYIKCISCNLKKMRQAVDELTSLTTDELWLAYINQLKLNLTEQMNGYEGNEEPPECEG